MTSQGRKRCGYAIWIDAEEGGMDERARCNQVGRGHEIRRKRTEERLERERKWMVSTLADSKMFKNAGREVGVHVEDSW
jgi:hypothetical protein